MESHDADRRVRRLTTKSQFVALLYGQFAGASSLREIEGALASHQVRIYHLGAAPVARSTLADANTIRPAGLFAGLFAHMVARASRGLRRQIGDAIRLVDATSIRLSGPAAEWARFSAKACGAKLHVVYDPDADRPLYAAVTTAKTADVTVAREMVLGLDPRIEKGATYVYDLGYYDDAWWAELDAAGCRILRSSRRTTRLKVNTALTPIEERAVEGDPEGVLSDRVGFLPARQAKSRKNRSTRPCARSASRSRPARSCAS